VTGAFFAVWSGLRSRARTGALAMKRGLFVLPLAAVTGAYGLASLAASLRATGHGKRRYLPALPVAFACLHLTYGLGFLVGLARTAHAAATKGQA
jgi:hypothetical protein